MWPLLYGLPPLLGVLGLLAFFVTRNQQRLDQVTHEVVDRLRKTVRGAGGKALDRLGPRQLARLLEQDQTIRAAVSEQDYALFQRVLADLRVGRLATLAVVVVLFVVGVCGFLYLHRLADQRRVRADDLRLTDDSERAAGLLVDTDPLRVTWSPAGDPADIEVELENPRTGKITQAKRVRSSDGAVLFSADEYRPILGQRQFGQSNPVRARAKAADRSFESKEHDLFVGVTIRGFPDFKAGGVVVGAFVDNSTDWNPNFGWSGDVVYRRKGETKPTVLPDQEFKQGDTLFLADFDRIDWRTFGMTYREPVEPRAVRQVPPDPGGKDPRLVRD